MLRKFQKSIIPIVFYCSQLFVNNRTMGFLKIDKGTPRAEFLFHFWNLTIKISILTKFRGLTFIFMEIMGGLKIAMQTCFMSYHPTPGLG